MTADLDLSPEAVERLAWRIDATPLYEGHGEESVLPELAAATLRALAAENARLRAERDAAWQAGAEAMRERAAYKVAKSGAIVDHPSVFMGGPSRNAIRIAGAFAAAIRALPLPGQPTNNEENT